MSDNTAPATSSHQQSEDGVVPLTWLKFQNIETIPYCETRNQIVICKFAHLTSYEHMVALGSRNGMLKILNTNSNIITEFRAHKHKINDLLWTEYEMKVLTTAYLNTIQYMDVVKFRPISSFDGHRAEPQCLTFLGHDVFASGGSDGCILIYDLRSKGVQRKIRNSHDPPCTLESLDTISWGMSSVKSLATLDENTIISCGANDSCIKFWDIRAPYNIEGLYETPTNIIKYPEVPNGNCYNCLMVDKQHAKLYVNCFDNNIYCFDLKTRNSEPIMHYTNDNYNRQNVDMRASISKDCNYLLRGCSSDNNAYIWDVKKSWPVVRLRGHKTEVLVGCWSQKKINCMLMTCCSERLYRLWTVPKCCDDSSYKGRADLMPERLMV